MDFRHSSEPAGWYFLCFHRDLIGKPHGMALGARRYVGFLDDRGRPTVLDGRCVHMGADLGSGQVAKGCVRCPFHGWEFAGDGRCRNIPAAQTIPEFARQSAYPTAERGGAIFFFNRPTAPYPMPFFDGASSEQLLPARPFEFLLNAPWYIAGANAFDVQHFRNAHDRTLVDEPAVDCPAPSARRMTATYAVTGRGWRDSLMRLIGGDRVAISITVWGGPLLLVEARTQRTTTYAVVSAHPLSESTTLVRTIVWTRRHRGALRWLDGANSRLRRSFIRAFLSSDAIAAQGVRYTPGTLIEADRALAEYFQWLDGLR